MDQIRLKCGQCGATMEVDKDEEILYCPSCGARELLRDDSFASGVKAWAKAYERTRETQRQMKLDEYENQKQMAAAKREYDKKDLKLGLMILAIILGVCLALASLSCTIIRINEKAGRLTPPQRSEELIGMDYNIVAAEFRDKGFTNVSTVTYDETDGAKSVIRVTINGDGDFYTTDWFAPDAAVRITYGDATDAGSE